MLFADCRWLFTKYHTREEKYQNKNKETKYARLYPVVYLSMKFNIQQNIRVFKQQYNEKDFVLYVCKVLLSTLCLLNSASKSKTHR